ncbi:hypothetical protein D4764_15G0013000 [Takifugu flavidus]|uniref:Uncharacterized protein n=1 Tax=Takifugu flavidus TaxID=433684 RepID=A0A5C6P2D7_9TELE|nr:hypothetical protein D4764_15G0013000 [Takifugu flavidus]
MANKRRRVPCPEFYDGVSERGKLPGPSPHADPEQGHRLPSPIDQPALNVRAHSSHRGARSPPLAPSLARDLLPGDTTVLMTRFGSSSVGLLGWGSLRSWFSWSRDKVPKVPCSSDGSAASTSLTSGVGGINKGDAQWRKGDQSGCRRRRVAVGELRQRRRQGERAGSGFTLGLRIRGTRRSSAPHLAALPRILIMPLCLCAKRLGPRYASDGPVCSVAKCSIRPVDGD